MLKAENLVLYVDENGSRKCLLDHISFQVDDGEMLVITGPNGGGKSTLAKTLMGIETPESGKIILNGEDITGYDINHRANAGIGYAFQQPPRFKGMTVSRLLTLAAGKKLPEKEVSVLAKEHSLCIFDEPEAGIDLWSFSMLIQKFEEIHKQKKQSLIVISHQEKIINMADKIMIIDNGKISKTGDKDEILPCLGGIQKCHKCVERR